jgi:signal transduction histidine kinase
MTALPIQAETQEVYRSLDRGRGLRLARLVSAIFGGLLLAPTLILGVVALLHPAQASGDLLVTITVFGASLVLYGVAFYLASQEREFLSSVAIILGTVSIPVVLQLTHARTAGLDSYVTVLLGTYIIAGPLSGVLVNASFMFGTTVFLNVVGAAVCYGSVGQVTSSAVTIWLLACVTQWVAVLLTFGAQSLYLQTLDEVGTLRAAIERAERLDDLKNQFIRSVNHELRNPIMAWYSCAVMLQRGDAVMSPSDRTEFQDRSVQIGGRVLRLVKSILSIPQLDPGSITVSPEVVNIRESVLAALDLIDPTERGETERDLHILMPADLAAWGDRTYVQQILTNLISNALKYSDAGTPITVAAQVMTPPSQGRERPAPVALLSVRDQGLGVPPDLVPLLFERFVRLPRDLASNVVGNGLGLFLCKALTEAMGGRIWLESTGIPGEGTTFFVQLPLPPK